MGLFASNLYAMNFRPLPDRAKLSHTLSSILIVVSIDTDTKYDKTLENRRTSQEYRSSHVEYPYLKFISRKGTVVVNIMVLVFHPICTSTAAASRHAVIFLRPNPMSLPLPDTLGVRNPSCCGQKQILMRVVYFGRKGNFKVVLLPVWGLAI